MVEGGEILTYSDNIDYDRPIVILPNLHHNKRDK